VRFVLWFKGPSWDFRFHSSFFFFCFESCFLFSPVLDPLVTFPFLLVLRPLPGTPRWGAFFFFSGTGRMGADRHCVCRWQVGPGRLFFPLCLEVGKLRAFFCSVLEIFRRVFLPPRVFPSPFWVVHETVGWDGSGGFRPGLLWHVQAF